MSTVVCPVCGNNNALLEKGSFDAIYNQIPVHLDGVEMVECPRCGESTLTPEESKDVSKRVKYFVRVQLSLLQPEEIVSIRQRYGLSQEELERLLGLGKKVVTRWERGVVLQGQAADVVLRLMDRLPGVVDELRKIRAEDKVPAQV